MVKKWDKSRKEYVEIPRPEIISLHNMKMGGVNLIGQFISVYRIFIRSRKWTLRVIFHPVDLAICNCWLEYNEKCIERSLQGKEIMDLLSFREEICNALLMANKSKVFDQDRLNTSTSFRAASVPPSRAIYSPLSAKVRLD